MLGYQGSHWSFLFNSDASFLEGEKITDMGEGFRPRRFVAGEAVRRFSRLDQYLMGFRPPDDVDPTFVVREPEPFQWPEWHPPGVAVGLDGARQDISIQDVIRAEGRRTPDSTVAQRRFRFAFILIVPAGYAPTAAELQRLGEYRQGFAQYFATATDGIAAVETTLKRAMHFSLSPAAGILAGGSGTALLTLQTPPEAAMTVRFETPRGFAQAPASITIPAGATFATFPLAGLNRGVEELSAVPPTDGPYEPAFARVQVADPSTLKLAPVSGDRQPPPLSGILPDPIVVRLTDINNLPYLGAVVTAAASDGGSVIPGEVDTDEQGLAVFLWTPGPAANSQLRLELKGVPAVSLTLNSGSAAPVVVDMQNAASFSSGVSAGALETLWGYNLAGGRTATASGTWPFELGGVRVALNGTPLRVLYVSDGQLNVYVPPGADLGGGAVTVSTPSGAQASAPVVVRSVQPGIFPGAILKSGTVERATATPVGVGDYIEVYCTGLGATHSYAGLQWTDLTPSIYIGAQLVLPSFSGLAPGFTGLYQVNVPIPPGVAAGEQPVMISVDGLLSNTVNIQVQ